MYQAFVLCLLNWLRTLHDRNLGIHDKACVVIFQVINIYRLISKGRAGHSAHIPFFDRLSLWIERFRLAVSERLERHTLWKLLSGYFLELRSDFLQCHPQYLLYYKISAHKYPEIILKKPLNPQVDAVLCGQTVSNMFERTKCFTSFDQRFQFYQTRTSTI